MLVSFVRNRVLGVLLLVLPGVFGSWTVAARADQEKDSEVSRVEQQAKDLSEEKELIQLFADTLEQVKSKYVGTDVSDRDLIEAAIRGMISRLDPYSNYIPPEDLAQFRRGVEREFVGIGVQVSDRDGHLQITSPLFDTPAWRAGLRAGDRILKIGDTSTRGLSLDEAVRLMTGEEGTEVTITVLHPDDTNAETIALRRERIQQPTVIGYHRSEEGVWDFFCDRDQMIAYVRITAFSGKTSADLERTLKQLLEQGMRGLVIDMRFNPGGMLSQAVEVSDLFLNEGRIVSIEGRGTRPQTWDARAEGTLIPRDFPLAVLVNRFSASAAEIVAACLQDNQAATIVGERTWGKGSVQNIIALEEGKSALKLTTAGYHRPNGTNIHREVGASEADTWGVHPDEGYLVPFDNDDLRGLGTLYAQQDELTKVQPRQGEPGQGDAEQPVGTEPFVDRQLNKALEVLRGRLGGTESTPAAESTVAEAVTPDAATTPAIDPSAGSQEEAPAEPTAAESEPPAPSDSPEPDPTH